MNVLYIDKNDGKGFRQYMFSPDEWDTLQKTILEGIEKGWAMDYRPAKAKEGQGS